MPRSVRDYTDQQIRIRLDTLSGHLLDFQKTSNPDRLRLIRVWARRSAVSMKLFERFYHSREYSSLLNELKTVVHDLSAARDSFILKQLVEGNLAVLNEDEAVAISTFLQLNSSSNEQGDSSSDTSDVSTDAQLLKRILKIELVKKFDSIAIRTSLNTPKNRVPHFKGQYKLPEADCEEQLLDMADEILSPAMSGVIVAAKCLDSSSKIAELHKLRICIKKLRYSIDLMLPGIEIVPKLHNNFAALHEKLRELQDSIGDIHDMDFVLHELFEMLSEAAASRSSAAIGYTKKNYEACLSFDAGIGLMKVANVIQAKRDSQFLQFFRAWNTKPTATLFRSCRKCLPNRA